ncbi:uncharacterized protein [Primulina huaijiensis]|uniref:uncharacterized protein isoform X1 n=2 Tax=Primulina huaijiensis TaxID=1492673 RepID=UPI003CC6E393
MKNARELLDEICYLPHAGIFIFRVKSLSFSFLCVQLLKMTVDWSFVHKIWEKWAANNVGSLGPPLKAALLLNYDPTGPSRLVSIIAEQEGIKADPIELSQLVGFVKKNKLQTEFFFVGTNQYLVTSIHENWFCARCLNSSNQAGEGAILMQTSAFLVVGLYEGSTGSASRAVVAVDQFAWLLGRRNL